jgi:hypothetical protein
MKRIEQIEKLATIMEKISITMLTHNFEGLSDLDADEKGNHSIKDDISKINTSKMSLSERPKNVKINNSNKLSRRLKLVNKIRNDKLNKSLDREGSIITNKENVSGETSTKSDITTGEELSQIRSQSSNGLNSGV